MKLDIQIKKWSVKKVIKELNSINWHIDNMCVGRWELWYQQRLYNELADRKIEYRESVVATAVEEG